VSDENHIPLVSEEAAGLIADTEAKVYLYFRHKKIRNFKVGAFEFKDHLMSISGTPAQAARLEAEFLKLHAGLLPMDQLNIVRVKHIANEEAVQSKAGTVRGPVDTGNINDKPIGENVPNPKAPSSPGFKFGLRQQGA